VRASSKKIRRLRSQISCTSLEEEQLFPQNAGKSGKKKLGVPVIGRLEARTESLFWKLCFRNNETMIELKFWHFALLVFNFGRLPTLGKKCELLRYYSENQIMTKLKLKIIFSNVCLSEA